MGWRKATEIISLRGRSHLAFWLVLTERVRGTSEEESKPPLLLESPFVWACPRNLSLRPEKYQLIVSVRE